MPVAVVTVLAVTDFIDPRSGASSEVLAGEPDARIEDVDGHPSTVVAIVPCVGAVERQIALIDAIEPPRCTRLGLCLGRVLLPILLYHRDQRVVAVLHRLARIHP